jgi:hypothetical protein
VTLTRYVYSTVRVVPYPASGEFVNIAVIAGSDETGEWSLRTVPNESRVRQFCGPDALAAAHDALSHIGFMIDLQSWIISDQRDEDDRLRFGSEEEVSEKWLLRLFERSQRVVQFSPPAPVLASTVDNAIDLVFPRVTVQPEKRTSTRLTKWRIMSDLGRGFLSAGLRPDDFLRNINLTVSGQKTFTHPLDFVIVSGDAVELVQGWSFQLASRSTLARDVKAWGWTLRELKQHGGTVQAEKRSIDIPKDIPICVVVAPPADEASRPIYDEALGVFEELSADVKQHGQEPAVASKAAQLVAKHRGALGYAE